MQRRIALFGVCVLLLLVACGKYSPAGEAIAQPPAEETPQAAPAAPPVEIPAAEQELPSSPPPPSLSDEELSAQNAASTAPSVTITAILNSAPGMTKVLVRDAGGEGIEASEEQYVYATTNRDLIIKRVAQRLGATVEEIATIITFSGEAVESHSRTKYSD